ncbi:hypothetical protein [Actinocrispum wychmicini]|uniref:Lipoprotein n=1 Tax=Actinocrispum wychmicini TaxID=1213861 RepID=A0A4V2S6W7_9PSEU|nr:hypothetical protein [Actinocrispum wychmicini]TCO57200.1 hypothetical protein EV192_106677 [Actinocrispum wychmicini]
MRAVWLVVLLVLAGCATTRPQPTKPTSAPRSPDAWAGFPVGRKPRPIVLLHTMPRAHRVDGRSADAGRSSTFETDPPSIAPTANVRLWDGMAVLPTIDASTALRAMLAQTKSPPLRVTRVDFGAAQFDTDRGPLTLPAWLFHTQDSAEPLVWPALDPSVFWRFDKVPSPESRPSGIRVTKVDGLKITVTLPHPHEPCRGKPPPAYHGEARESDTSVMVTAVPEHATGCAPATSTLAPFDITLARPLGDRVLVDGANRPIPVN